MPKLTDEEVGQLLRETFTEKEELVDHLPEATISPVRRGLPVLLAAASVLVVLAGVAVAARLQDRSGPPSVAQSPAPVQTIPVLGSPQARTAAALEVADISGLAIAEMSKWERPDGGWPVVNVFDAPRSGAASPTNSGTAGSPFGPEDRSVIAALAGVSLEWVTGRPAGSGCGEAPYPPYLTLGPVVFDKSGSTATIGMGMWRSCDDGRWLTYRLERVSTVLAQNGGSDWRIAGTVGPESVS